MFNRREKIIINNIEVSKPNKAKEIWNRLKSKAEDYLFWLIEHMPEKMIPGCIMEWAGSYVEKRLAELQHEQVKNEWRTAELEKVVEELNKKEK